MKKELFEKVVEFLICLSDLIGTLVSRLMGLMEFTEVGVDERNVEGRLLLKFFDGKNLYSKYIAQEERERENNIQRWSEQRDGD